MVQPMTMRADPRPAQTFEIPLKIQNTGVGGPKRIQLRLVELSQGDVGNWELVEPGADVDLSGHASSLTWTSLSEDSVDIDPQVPATIMVSMRPPANARGVYFAGIVAETPLPDNPVGLVVRTRFLIPLIVEIKGRTVPERVSLVDTSMTFASAAAGGPPTTSAFITVSNAGQTFSRVRGELAIESSAGDQWRVVTRVGIDERGIIPGATLILGRDLERRLPSGKYRLRANLFVDGRRTPPLQKEIDFEGDPSADIAFDNTLLLEPGNVDVKIVPGATRTTVMRIANAGSDPVQIEVLAATPRSLLGVQMGELLGTDLSAEPWVRIVPSTFSLRANGHQNVRVISSVPDNGADQPNYYADLVLSGRYPNGQSAGETTSTIHLANSSVPSSAAGNVESLSAAEAEGSNFIFNLDFVNVGNVDVIPIAKVTVMSSGGEALLSQALSDDNTPLLPLSRRRFSGELSLASIEPGDYSVLAAVDIGAEQPISRRYLLSIAAPEGSESAPTISLTDPASDDAGSLDVNKDG